MNVYVVVRLVLDDEGDPGIRDLLVDQDVVDPLDLGGAGVGHDSTPGDCLLQQQSWRLESRDNQR